MKVLQSILVIAVLFSATSCVNVFKLADIRTETAKLETKTQDRALILLKDMQAAHGVENWKNIDTYQVEFEDEFFGFMGKQSHPYKEQNVSFLLSYIPGTYDGRLMFTSGEQKDQEWGIQSWQSYSKKPNESLTFKKNKDISFWVPTYQYFIEFPARISSANAYTYAGEKTIEGIACEGIIASWNSTEPQKEVDQYLIWIDKKTKLIVKLEYTVRDAYKFVAGAAIYKDYTTYEGIVFPARMPVESNLVKNGYLHEMRIKSFAKNPISVDFIRVNNDLTEVGDSKSE